MNHIATGWIWFGFSIFLIIALSIDTFLGNKKLARPYESIRAALTWTCVWIVCALLFNGLLWLYLYFVAGAEEADTKALMFFTGYLIEKTLSLDNLFVFYLIFEQFRVPLAYQQRVLSLGIWGAIVMRLVLILLGVWLVEHFHWLLYLLGIFLVWTGAKIIILQQKEKNLADSVLMKLINRCIRTTNDIEGDRFFITKNHLRYATPLFIALIFVEFSDLIFALDSIPAIFAITTDPFLVWSSNVFAILGLRALYFLLVGMVQRFKLLKYGIALILVFVGCKMLIAPWIQLPALVSLGVIVGILLIFTLMSLKGKER